MDEFVIEAKVENLDEVLAFIDERLENAGCSMKVQTQIDIAVEEIFVNIASYAYAPGVGNADIGFMIDGEPSMAVIRFTDKGTPYNPLEKADPDITLPAEERPIGGLGIYMVKKSMDEVEYEYKDGCNVFTIKKKLD